jgi:arginine/ornithine N-succinyltransferase beta subunit
MRNPYATDNGLTSLYSDNEASWNNISLAEKARIGYILNAADGDFFMTKE